MSFAIRSLEVILKVTERCNINCTYCYYFNGDNDDYKNKPKHITSPTMGAVTEFIARAVQDHGIERVQIDLHGGEPLLLKKEEFSRLARTMRARLDPLCELRISLQTNGTLIDDAWIDLFSAHQVSVSVSLDGDMAQHDAQRVDFRNRGTYHRTVAGLAKLRTAHEAGRIPPGGVLCVIQPEQDGAAVYRHFVDTLGVRHMHFIEPDTTRDNMNERLATQVQAYLLAVLGQWMHDRDYGVTVRIFEIALQGLLPAHAALARPVNEPGSDHDFVAITIRSDGSIDPADDLRNAQKKLFNLGYSVFEHSLGVFLLDARITALNQALSRLPANCTPCAFRKICRAGEAFSNSANRYSLVRGFENRSVYCSAYQHVLLGLTQHLISRGIQWARIEQALDIPAPTPGIRQASVTTHAT